MIYVLYYHNVPSKDFPIEPSRGNHYGKVVGDYLIDYNIIPPIEWCPKPEKKDRDGLTFAMKCAKKGMIPPKYMYHDPNLV